MVKIEAQGKLGHGKMPDIDCKSIKCSCTYGQEELEKNVAKNGHRSALNHTTTPRLKPRIKLHWSLSRHKCLA